MALQQTAYHNLPVEINLHILKFLELETLVDTVRYIDKKHRLLVIDILKNYTLTKNDCDSYWFEFIQFRNTRFLHSFLKPQHTKTMIRSAVTHTNSLPWDEYLKITINHATIKNNYILFGNLILRYTNYRNIRKSISNDTIDTTKWYLSLIRFHTLSIVLAIEHNSLSIISFILEADIIKFNFNKDDIEEKIFEYKMYHNFANVATSFNKVDSLTYFTLNFKYTNAHYNELLIACVTNQIIDTAIQENKPNVMAYIISILTNSKTDTHTDTHTDTYPFRYPFCNPNSNPINSNTTDINGNPYQITDLCISNFITQIILHSKENYKIINIITYFITKFSNKITIEHYKQIMSHLKNININKFKPLFTLYLESYDIFPGCVLFTPDELLNDANLMNVISHIKSSFIYECFINSIKINNYEIMTYLKEILLTTCIKYNITKEMFVKYLVLDCIKKSIICIADKSNDITHTHPEIYTILIKDLPSIYDIDNIISIMNILSLEIYNVAIYEYFYNLFLQKSVLTKQIVINLLKNNLYLSIQNTKYDIPKNNVLTFIILKLNTIGETNLFTDARYIPLFINFITNKYIYIIDIMCSNGFDVIHNNEYLYLITNYKCIKTITIIKLLIKFGAPIASYDYKFLHFILKQKHTKKIKELILFIKYKLSGDNKLQLYLDWETNLDYKTKFLEKT